MPSSIGPSSFTDYGAYPQSSYPSQSSQGVMSSPSATAGLGGTSTPTSTGAQEEMSLEQLMQLLGASSGPTAGGAASSNTAAISPLPGPIGSYTDAYGGTTGPVTTVSQAAQSSSNSPWGTSAGASGLGNASLSSGTQSFDMSSLFGPTASMSLPAGASQPTNTGSLYNFPTPASQNPYASYQATGTKFSALA